MRQFIQFRVLVLIVLALFVGPSVSPVLAGQEKIERENDIAYGEAGGAPLLLDVYYPSSNEADRPTVMLFSWGLRIQMYYQALTLARSGYVAIAVDYPDLEGTWPAQLDAAQRAVRFVRANAARFGVDPERVCAYGFSAGAYIAATVGARETRVNDDPELEDVSSRVDCVIDLAGESDLTIPSRDDYSNTETVEWLGATIEEAPERYRDASPMFNVDAETAPFLIVHGAADDVIPVEHSRSLVAALQAAGVDLVYVEIADGSHFAADNWAVVGPWVLAFLQQHLQPTY